VELRARRREVSLCTTILVKGEVNAVGLPCSGRDHPYRRACRALKPLHVNRDMPVAWIWNPQPNWRLPGEASNVSMLMPAAVSLEVAMVQQSNVRSVPRQRDLNYVAVFAQT